VRVKHLVIVGGPSGAGKSSLLQKIMDAENPHLCKQLGIDDPSLCQCVPAIHLDRVTSSSFDTLIVHYDFYRQYSIENGFNYLSKLFQESEIVTILTLCVAPRILIDRNAERIGEVPKPKLSDDGLTKKKLLQRRAWWEEQSDFYSDGHSLLSLHSKWFIFLLKNRVTNHFTFDSSSLKHIKAESLDKNVFANLLRAEALST